MLPEWMMLNLGIEKGDEIVLRSVNLEKGKYVKLNPLNENFLKLHNPKVILEKTLRQFACLTPGDIIPIVYNDVKYDIEVVETNPSIGISVIDTDCEVEFSLNEPELKPESRPVIADCRKKKMEEDVNIFTPFSGKARRLDEGGVKDVESEGDGFGKRYMANVVISLPAAVVVKQSEVKEAKEKKFVAFSGKKYTLS
ncbi:ubiquitin recognition factor in ER-associated degradation protein 1-like [Impatiens glandulifera]|uniref:ubiquitin recognition factor in ER-associated degradation protein 1-like n=1 Tax=Impatiens glandulifera TaxID=253017 RepID=UPI001FB15492|nr:ubiquitin recognition factor in ER-associated degradation protein 1-like [Impatiens glandulifera]